MHAPDPHTVSAQRQASNPVDGQSGLQTTLLEGSLSLALTVPDLQPGLLGIFGAGQHWARPGGVFGLWISPRGGLVLRHRTATANLVWEGDAEFCGAGDRLRISYQVWQPLGYAVLRAENGTTGASLQTRLTPVEPVPLTEGWTDLPDAHQPQIELAAMPIAPRGLNAFGYGTQVPTPHGPFFVEQLLPGDIIQAPTGPVTIRDVWIEPMTDVQRQEAIVLRAPYFGLAQSITVLPEQRFLVASVEAQSVTGHPEVLLAAQDMVIGRAITPDWAGYGPMVHLAFDKTLVLPLGGLSLVCPGTTIPGQSGAILPSPGDVPWASHKEARAVIEGLAHRKGILPENGLRQTGRL